MCWIITGCSVVWRKPAILHGLAVTHGRAAFANRILRVVFATAYAFSLLAGSGTIQQCTTKLRILSKRTISVHIIGMYYIADFPII